MAKFCHCKAKSPLPREMCWQSRVFHEELNGFSRLEVGAASSAFQSSLRFWTRRRLVEQGARAADRSQTQLQIDPKVCWGSIPDPKLRFRSIQIPSANAVWRAVECRFQAVYRALGRFLTSAWATWNRASKQTDVRPSSRSIPSWVPDRAQTELQADSGSRIELQVSPGSFGWRWPFFKRAPPIPRWHLHVAEGLCSEYPLGPRVVLWRKVYVPKNLVDRDSGLLR